VNLRFALRFGRLQTADLIMWVAAAAAVVAVTASVVGAATAMRGLEKEAVVAAMVAFAASAAMFVAVIAAVIVRNLDDPAVTRGAPRVAGILGRAAAPYLPGDPGVDPPWAEEWPALIEGIPGSWHRPWDVAWALAGMIRVAAQARATQLLDRILASDVLSYMVLGAAVVGTEATLSLLHRIAPAIVSAGPILVAGVKILGWLRERRSIERRPEGDTQERPLT
jgi:hypothetical protein